MIIEGKKIGLNKPTFFIADIAANHDGDLSKAIDLIHMSAECGADAAKFLRNIQQIIESPKTIFEEN